MDFKILVQFILHRKVELAAHRNALYLARHPVRHLPHDPHCLLSSASAHIPYNSDVSNMAIPS